MAEGARLPTAAPMARGPLSLAATRWPASARARCGKASVTLALHGGPPHRGAATRSGSAPRGDHFRASPEMRRSKCVAGSLETSSDSWRTTTRPAALAVTSSRRSRSGCARQHRARTRGGPHRRAQPPAPRRPTIYPRRRGQERDPRSVRASPLLWTAHAPAGRRRLPPPAPAGIQSRFEGGGGRVTAGGEATTTSSERPGLAGSRGGWGLDPAPTSPPAPPIPIRTSSSSSARVKTSDAILGPGVVDATIGVVDHRSGVEARPARQRPSSLARCLRVVNVFRTDAPRTEERWVEQLLERRQRQPVALRRLSDGRRVDEGAPLAGGRPAARRPLVLMAVRRSP